MSKQDRFSVLEIGKKKVIEGYYLDNIIYSFEIKKEEVYLKGCKNRRIVGKVSSSGSIVYSDFKCGKAMDPAYVLSKNENRVVYYMLIIYTGNQ